MSDDLRYWIAEVCRERRREAGLVQAAIGGSINITEQRIKRFENSTGFWPPQTGEIVDAYARETGSS